ncbi:phage major capsid protein [Agrococcus sp. DT81.2]|uniref:phage major capsid protein n=1 Tax=Agrococcus sp. DT81.2 TaxID=3393414 RepID=UPI003CE5B7D2
MTIQQIKDRAEASLKAARAIVDTADAAGRGLTVAEEADVDRHIADAKTAKGELVKAAAQQMPQGWGLSVEQLDGLKAAGVDLGLGAGDGVPGADGARRDYKGQLAAKWAGAAADRLTAAREPLGGAKAAISVGVGVPQPITEPVSLPQERHTILNLIPVKQVAGANLEGEGGGNVFGYTVQTTRTNNAAAVPDGALKPTSSYQWSERVDRFRTIAHLSEPQPNRLLADRPALVRFLEEEMGRGVLDEIEGQILAGTGTIGATEPATPTPATEQLPGILETSGVRAQAWTTDLLTTLSTAYDTLTLANEQPTAWVMNPLDYRKLKNMRESGTTGPLMFKSGRSSIEQILGEIPIVESNLMPQGVALLGDFRQTLLVVRDEVRLESNQGATELFDRNLTKYRAEGRYGFAVLRPGAFIEVDLTA